MVITQDTRIPSLFQYQLWNKDYEIMAVKLVIAILLIVFSILEIAHRSKDTIQ